MADKLGRLQVTIFGSLFIGYALYVCCRKGFAFLLPVISDQEHLTKQDLGVIISAQNTAATISKFLFGIFSDYVGGRLLFVSGLLGASLSVLGFSQVHSTSLYATFWFLNGICQGCGWPACAKLLGQWFRHDQFGTYWSLLSASLNVAGGIIPLILPILLIWSGNWRNFMVATSIISAVWAGIVALTLAEKPEDVGLPPVNPDSTKKDDNHRKSSIGWSTLLKSPILWFVSFYYFMVYAARTSCENWAQLFLVEERGLDELQAGQFVSSFETGGFVGSLVTGYITDWVITMFPRSTSNPRMFVSIIYMFGAAIFTHLLVSFSSLASVWGFILGFCLYGNINIYGIVATECAPTHISGTSHAIVVFAANFGSIISGLPFSYFANLYGWSGIFYLLEMCFILCFVCKIVTINISGKIKED